MENDARIVKAILAVGVLRVLTNPNAPELRTNDERGPALKAVADVTEDLFQVLFPSSTK